MKSGLRASTSPVEGSCEPYDEPFAFRGPESEDVANFHLVAQYVECAGRFGTE